MPAIMISGMVSSSSLPDRPSRRDGFGRGDKVVGCSSVSDTMSAFNGPAHDPPKCGRFGDNIMRQLNIWSAIGRKKNGYPLLLIALRLRMRFAPEPVKLRIANVQQFRI